MKTFHYATEAHIASGYKHDKFVELQLAPSRNVHPLFAVSFDDTGEVTIEYPNDGPFSEAAPGPTQIQFPLSAWSKVVKWVDALESGTYSQVTGALIGCTICSEDGAEAEDHKHDGNDSIWGFCCLGVGCELTDTNGWDGTFWHSSDGLLPRPTDEDEAMSYRDYPNQGWMKPLATAVNYRLPWLTSGTKAARIAPQDVLAGMNDNGVTFKEIAAYIRKVAVFGKEKRRI